jgi:GntR family transcriptional regulator
MFDSINAKSGLPIYRQITDQIHRAVAAGKLQPGDQLPSVRELAAQLLVNPNTVAKVYRDLERDGLLAARRGQGTYISPSASSLADLERFRLIAEQLAQTARDVRAFGVPPERAVELFRSILTDGHAEKEDRS